jgi:hypothetical protein
MDEFMDLKDYLNIHTHEPLFELGSLIPLRPLSFKRTAKEEKIIVKLTKLLKGRLG